MSYLSIDNLYKNADILMFKECYALEKIHGTSAHIRIRRQRQMVVGPIPGINEGAKVYTEAEWQAMWPDEIEVTFFAGGEKHANFIKLFDEKTIADKAREMFPWPEVDVLIYGEAYGGKCQGMSATYGKELKFIVFEVKVGHSWLAVPKAFDVARQLGLEFVWYCNTPTDIPSLDAVRLRKSEQAKRNGCGDDKEQEGIVLRPLIELRKNSGERIIAKYKNESFIETRSKRPLGEKSQVLIDADKIADEWVTEMRLSHVLNAFPEATINDIPVILKAMVDDVEKESKGEVVLSHDAKRAISRATAVMFKNRIKIINTQG